MLFFDGGFGLLFIALWIFCLIDVITTPERECRNLPKLAWVFIVLLLMDVGSILWLVAGRTWNRNPADRATGGDAVDPARAPVRRMSPGRPVPRSLPSPRPNAVGPPTGPDDDEGFLAGLRQRADEQRRRAREGEPPEQPEPPG